MLHFIHERIGCSGDRAIEVARASYVENKLHEHRTRVGHSVLCPIVLDNEGDEDEDDTARLSDLIALAGASLQMEKDKDDTGRLNELIALADVGLKAEEDEEAFFSHATEAADEAEAAYYRRQADQGNAGEPSHMNEEEENVFLS